MYLARPISGILITIREKRNPESTWVKGLHRFPSLNQTLRRQKQLSRRWGSPVANDHGVRCKLWLAWSCTHRALRSSFQLTINPPRLQHLDRKLWSLPLDDKEFFPWKIEMNKAGWTETFLKIKFGMGEDQISTAVRERVLSTKS